MANYVELPCGCARGAHGRKAKDIANCQAVKRHKRARIKKFTRQVRRSREGQLYWQLVA